MSQLYSSKTPKGEDLDPGAHTGKMCKDESRDLHAKEGSPPPLEDWTAPHGPQREPGLATLAS